MSCISSVASHDCGPRLLRARVATMKVGSCVVIELPCASRRLTGPSTSPSKPNRCALSEATLASSYKLPGTVTSSSRCNHFPRSTDSTDAEAVPGADDGRKPHSRRQALVDSDTLSARNGCKAFGLIPNQHMRVRVNEPAPGSRQRGDIRMRQQLLEQRPGSSTQFQWPRGTPVADDVSRTEGMQIDVPVELRQREDALSTRREDFAGRPPVGERDQQGSIDA